MPAVLNPALYKLAAYNLPLVAIPVDVCSSKLHQSKVVPITVSWTAFPTFAVQINLNQGTPGQTLDKIVGVYIDNSANVSDLILVCPDTGYSIIVPSQQQRFFPLFSRTNILNVYNGSLSNTLFNNAPIRIILTNFLVDEFDTQAFVTAISWAQASSSIVGGAINQNYNSFVLGDSNLDGSYSLTTSGITPILTAPAFTGFFIITNLTASIFNCYSTGNPVALTCGLQSGGQNRTAWNAYVTSDGKCVPFTSLYQQGSKYLQLDAAQVLYVYNTNALPGGFLYLSFDYAWILNKV